MKKSLFTNFILILNKITIQVWRNIVAR